MPPSARDPWFAPADGPAVSDFWDAYQWLFAAIECPTHLRPLRVRLLLTAAFEEGSWAGFEDILVHRGRSFAVNGRDPAPLLVSTVVRVVSASLIETLGSEPRRLGAALDIAERFGQRRVTVLREAYQSAHGAAWAQRSVAKTLDSIGDGVISTDADGLVERMNPVALRLSDWTLDDARGERLDVVFRVVDEQTGLVVPSRIDEVLAGAVVTSLPRHAAILSKNATLRSIGDSMAPIYDDAGAVRGAVVVFRDRTQEIADEHAMESLQLALAHSQRLVEELVAQADGDLVTDRIRRASQLLDELHGKLATFRADLGRVVEHRGIVDVDVTERLRDLDRLAEQMQQRIVIAQQVPSESTESLTDAVEWQAREHERVSGIEVRLDTSGAPEGLEPAGAALLVQVLEHALTASRQPGVTRIEGRLAVDSAGDALLQLGHNGTAEPASRGFLAVAQRVAFRGGSFRIEPAGGGGSVLSVSLPLSGPPMER